MNRDRFVKTKATFYKCDQFTKIIHSPPIKNSKLPRPNNIETVNAGRCSGMRGSISPMSGTRKASKIRTIP